MAVNKPRHRLVNFRVSDDEFENLVSATYESDARSMSEHVRNLVLVSISQSNPQQVIVAEIEELKRQVADITTMLKELLGQSTAPSPSINPEEQLANGGVHH